MQAINTQTNSLRFALFMQEGLNYVNSWTPTEINAGGCGIFAELLSTELNKYGIEHEICALYYSPKREGSMRALTNTLSFLKDGKNVKDAGADHIVVKIGDIYVDATGLCNQLPLSSYKVIVLTKEQLSDLDKKSKCWNPIFDRSQTPFITKKLDEMFEQFDNFIPGYFKLAKEGDVQLTDHTVRNHHILSFME